MPENNLLTQIQRLIVYMFMHPEKTWWIAQDFMPPALEKNSPYHVGYEATARMSEMLAKYCVDGSTSLFDTQKQQKFRAVRIRWEDFEKALKDYPELILLAEKTDIMSRYSGLAERIEEHKQVVVVKLKKFKSYV